KDAEIEKLKHEADLADAYIKHFVPRLEEQARREVAEEILTQLEKMLAPEYEFDKDGDGVQTGDWLLLNDQLKALKSRFLPPVPASTPEKPNKSNEYMVCNKKDQCGYFACSYMKVHLKGKDCDHVCGILPGARCVPWGQSANLSESSNSSEKTCNTCNVSKKCTFKYKLPPRVSKCSEWDTNSSTDTCPGVDNCHKIKIILDKDLHDFQFREAIVSVCDKCEAVK
ncbi:MAG: hypothetical protein PHU23_17890, partial [Dehalococcoidales bacterium]|nr:hypothetical protein [Dehalococcoidales bacterium]